MITQALINILYLAAIYYIVGQSFQIIYTVSKYFNLTIAAIISLSSYLFYCFYQQLNLSWFISGFLSISISVLIFVLLEYLVIHKLQKRNASSLILLICSLGFYVIIEGLLSLMWGNSSLQLGLFDIQSGYELFNGYITVSQIITIALAIIVAIIIYQILYKTRTGIKMRAFSDNKNLSTIFGVKSTNIFIFSYLFGIIVVSILGILFSSDIGLYPQIGFNLLLYGIVTMIIGGARSINGLIFGAVLLSFSQFIGSYYLNSQWMDAIAYVILILFLIWKPLGFSGKQLKKVNL